MDLVGFFSSSDISIPLYRQKLLFVSSKQPKGSGVAIQINIGLNQDGRIDFEREAPDDPSTIYSSLVVRFPEATHVVKDLPYFPTYTGMTPEQRGVYLAWLTDITKPVSIGYAFVYFYGLERHLIFGDFEGALKEILLLRKYHDNPSFQGYSASAILHSCLLRKRIDVLENIYFNEGFNYFDNSTLLILHQNSLGLTPEMLIQLAYVMPGVNRKYLRQDPDLFRQELTNLLMVKFSKGTYSFADRYNLENVEGIPYPILANISFPSELRSPPLPNLIRHQPFQMEMIRFYDEVSELVKQNIFSRKKSKSTKTKNLKE